MKMKDRRLQIMVSGDVTASLNVLLPDDRVSNRLIDAILSRHGLRVGEIEEIAKVIEGTRMRSRRP
jgi:hypothetical protein